MLNFQVAYDFGLFFILTLVSQLAQIHLLSYAFSGYIT